MSAAASMSSSFRSTTPRKVMPARVCDRVRGTTGPVVSPVATTSTLYSSPGRYSMTTSSGNESAPDSTGRTSASVVTGSPGFSSSNPVSLSASASSTRKPRPPLPTVGLKQTGVSG
nr:hypothetical protein [Halapricum sp. CBA1109]